MALRELKQELMDHAAGGEAGGGSVWHLHPRDAWQLMQRYTSALIDVRTSQEWDRVGYPDTDASQATLHLNSLCLAPDYRINPEFMDVLQRDVTDKDTPCFFLCKIGGRSAKAAQFAADAGYSHVINIIHGYEGEPNEAGITCQINGWKAEGLAWTQA